MLIDINLKDGSVLMGCAIFPEEVENGEENIRDIKVIEEMLTPVPWGRKVITYKNTHLQGKLHVNHIHSYSYYDDIQC